MATIPVAITITTLLMIRSGGGAETDSSVTSSRRFLQWSIRNVSLTSAERDLETIARKPAISIADFEAATGVVDHVLQMNYSTLSTAREDVSIIVRRLDAVLTRVRLAPGESWKRVKSQLATFVLNMEQQPPVAVALETRGRSGGLEGSFLRTISSAHEIESPDVDVAVLLPQQLTTQFSHIALAIFSDDSAFQDPEHKANSRIVSINMIGATALQNGQYVDIVLRPWEHRGNKTCVFWDFTLSGGSWSADGCELLASADTAHDVCRCRHLTHFAEIISPPGVAVDPAHREVLDIISIVGCSLSLVGLLGIFFTGAAFRQWRENLGNKILLHMSTAVSINMLVFLIVATGLLRAHIPCMIFGVMLHYSVLASFCWMLVSAGLQFMRLMTVLGSQHISHLLFKVSLFAWGAPLLPVTVLLSVDLGSYAPDVRGFCYPGGLGFYFAVLMPVLIIITANLIVFGMILQRVFGGDTVRRHMKSKRKLAMRQVTTSVLLFFLLGLTWVFGLMAGLSMLFAYLFCITATLQGFVLFLFFVLGEKKARHYWKRSSAIRRPATSTASTPAETMNLRARDEPRGP